MLLPRHQVKQGTIYAFLKNNAFLKNRRWGIERDVVVIQGCVLLFLIVITDICVKASSFYEVNLK